MVPIPGFLHNQIVLYISIIQNYSLDSILNMDFSIGYDRLGWSVIDRIYFQLVIAQVCELLDVSFFDSFQ